MAAVSILRSKLEAYVSSTNKALDFKLVRNEVDVHSDKASFKPEFTHQIFGDNESVFGYRDLSIQLYYTSASLHPYLGMNYSEKIDPSKYDGVEADVILPKIAEKLQPGFATNLDEFILSITSKNSKFKPYGEKLHEFTNLDPENMKRIYEIYKCDITTAGFKNYFERLQTFVLWYIDAASFIDVDDEKWKFYLVYEKYKDCENQRFAIAGFCTVYHYYAYPNLTRPRISQMLVLPPFQRRGIGAELLQTICTMYVADPEVLDITVEDPSEEFVRLRDYLDSKNCLKLKSFKTECLRDGFSEEMATEAQMKLKLNKKQSRRIYEILRLRITDTGNCGQYRSYRLDIKNRLNLPFQKQQSDLMKLQKTLRPEELKATLNYTNKEQRIEQLERQYQELETDYRRVLDRLAMSKLSS
uniref:Histone acetyltransferase type B catalytic subunit n=1 Tax=Strigamia maritima TaxID=126957 RepID=T1IZF3_STRMM